MTNVDRFSGSTAISKPNAARGSRWQRRTRRNFTMAATSAFVLRPLAMAALSCVALPSQALPVVWVGPANGFWDVASNWDTGLPTLSSDALLGANATEFRSGNVALQSFTGTGTLTISGGTLAPSAASSTGGLVMRAGVLDGAGTVTVTGAATWSGGTMAGPGVTSFNNTLALNGNSRTRAVSGRTLNFNGITTWTNSNLDNGANPGWIAASNGATLNNTGSWLDQVSYSTAITSSGNASTFNNSGSYIKSGTASTDIQTVFNNTAAGTVSVNNNVLYLSGGGTLNGRLDAASGAALVLNTGTFSVSGITAGAGGGQLVAGGATVNATGTNVFGGTLAVTAGLLNASGVFNASGYSGSGGTLGGTGTVNVNGAGNWSAGAMTGAGITNFNSTLALNSNTRLRSISGRTVNFNGTTTWTNSNLDNGANPGLIAVSNGSTLNNTGSWLDQVSYLTAITASGSTSTFNNSGSYTKNGTAYTDIQPVFNNTASGTLTVNNNVLYLSGGGVLNGTLDAASGATLALNAGTFSVTGITPGAGGGQLLAGGATVNATGSNTFGGTLAVSAGLLNVSGSFNAGGYNGSGGTLTGTGTVNVNGAGVWSAGAITGAGTSNFNNTLALNSNTRLRSISGRTVNFNGTTTWTNSNLDNGANPGLIAVSNGSTLNNTGSWLDQVSYLTAITSSGNASTFNNSGSYTKNGTAYTDIQTVFNNTASGAVTVNSNVLYLSGGGVLNATLDAASGATLALNAGTFSVTGITPGSGGGQLLAGGATVNATGSNTFGGTLAVSAGLLNVSGVFNASGYNGSGGTLTGTGTVNVNGAGVWSAGAITGAGTTNFNSTLALNSNTRLRSISGRTVNFNGTTTWTNSNLDNGANPGLIAVSNGATLNNTGSWLDQVSYQTAITSSGNASTFNNSGSYIKNGTAYTDIQTVFNNTASGTVTVNNNVLYLSGGGTLNGTLDAASGATLALNTGTFNVTGTTAGIGGGQLVAGGATVNASGTNAFGGSLGVSAGLLNVSGVFNANGYSGTGGTLTGTGTVNINGAGVWNAGAMTGAGASNFNGTLALNGNNRLRSISGRTVAFNGTTTWTNSNLDNGANPGLVAVSNGATLNNTGVWLDQVSYPTAITSSGNLSTFNNSGNYTKSGAVTTDLSAVNYVNTGTTNVQQGTLQLAPNFVNPGTLKGNGTLSSTRIINNGHVAPGDTVGTLTMTGSFEQTALGSLDIDLQTFTSKDLLRIAGSAALNGALNLSCVAGCSFAAGQSFMILDAASGGLGLTGIFSSVSQAGFGNIAFNVVYDRNNGDVILTVVPEPGTWALWLGGLTAMGFVRRRRSVKA